MTSGSLLYDTGSRMSVFCENLEGWGGEGGGREVQEGRDIYMHTSVHFSLFLSFSLEYVLLFHMSLQDSGKAIIK